jgi:hypothetical protein
MKLKIFFTLLIVFALAAVASAQTKISGTQQCAKADQEHSFQVGDQPNHSFVISQGKCNWTKGWEIAGMQSKDTVETVFREIRGNTLRARGYDVDTIPSGDKTYTRFEATFTLKDGVPQTGDGKWTFVGGTGKLKGIKGKGTCKLTSAAADGSGTYDCEGEYELPK